MAAWFTTSNTVLHVSPVPHGITAAQVVDMLQSHEFYMKCNPHMAKYEPVETPKDPFPAIPEGRQVTATSEPDCYKVTDKVHTLPAGLWDSNVESRYEFINVERGVFVRIRSPLNCVMETVWTARDKDDGSVELIEEVLITCSRVLVGTITSMCESSWEGIHKTMIDKLRDK